MEPGSHLLQVSYVGLKPQQQTVTVVPGQTTQVSFALTESAAELSEVIVTGGTAIVNRPASASKAGLAPLDLPQSTAIITNTVIADQQVNSLGDVLKNVSGVSLTQQRQGVAETFSEGGLQHWHRWRRRQHPQERAGGQYGGLPRCQHPGVD